MAFQIIWSASAAQDVEAIVEFISRDSIFYASRVAQRIVAAVERCSTFPKMGRMVPEFEDDEAIREVIVYSYRIIYRLKANAIHVAAVVHGSLC